MELDGLAAESRHSHGVLEETSGVAVMSVSARGRQGPQRSADGNIASE